jgi:hypothetical protein
MALQPTTPDTKALSGVFSNSQGSSGIAEVKFVPRNLDGSILDCTGMTGIDLRIPQPNLSSPQATVAVAGTVGTADSTGVIFSMSISQMGTLISNWFSTGVSIPFSAVGSDGTDSWVLNNGTLVMKVVQ